MPQIDKAANVPDLLQRHAQNPEQAYAQVQEHIALIAKHEQEFLEQRSSSEKLGDRMAGLIGSLSYVFAHIVFLILWILCNTLSWPTLPHFDPFPFPLLDTGLAFEAILVASFILMRQSRGSRRTEERDQLMLQILLLTEREITALIQVQREVAAHIGLKEIANSQEITQLSQETSIDEVAQIIKENLPPE